MGIPLDGVGRGRDGAARGEWSTEKGVGRVRAERAGIAVIDWSVDWNALFANHA